jgi:hypothetical protein
MHIYQGDTTTLTTNMREEGKHYINDIPSFASFEAYDA